MFEAGKLLYSYFNSQHKLAMSAYVMVGIEEKTVKRTCVIQIHVKVEATAL